MVFGIVFAGIGSSVIIGLWSMSGFGEPPLMFKMFGSFIALAFVAVGVTFFLSSVRGTSLPGGNALPTPPPPNSAGEVGYKCPACGARLGEGADVSPKGDVKCGYCKQWFNIHG
jgi:DNA-directed RNA polymerase subunit RPC12/RpoP